MEQDNIATQPDLGMETTAGSAALVGSRVRRNADVVQRVCLPHLTIISHLHENLLTRVLAILAHRCRDDRHCQGQSFRSSLLIFDIGTGLIKTRSYHISSAGSQSLPPLSLILTLRRTAKARAGWSPVGGQTQSAYVRGGIQEEDTVAGHSV